MTNGTPVPEHTQGFSRAFRVTNVNFKIKVWTSAKGRVLLVELYGCLLTSSEEASNLSPVSLQFPSTWPSRSDTRAGLCYWSQTHRLPALSRLRKTHLSARM